MSLSSAVRSTSSHHSTPVARAAPVAIARWLFAVAGLVLLMVIVGGITRLTESGLSITEWRVVTGILPPLSEAAWMVEFEKYRQVPQYAAIHAGMSLEAFKFIYFWEWAHRILGRVIGLAFALPLAWFWVRGMIPRGYKLRLVALLALGGLQGAVGWWMVTSGLFQGVAVSHYRLATHLSLALFILAGLVWTALDLLRLARGHVRPARLTAFTATIGALLFGQIVLGAWVAGMDAGKVAQDWPLMGGRVVPYGIDWSRGVLHAVSSDPYLTHFIHRWSAWIVAAALIVLAIRVKRAGGRPASIAIHAAVGTQVLLGIATVMSGVNIVLATAHQGVGALLVAATAWGTHVLGRRTR